MQESTYVIGDIHGCLATVERLLEKINPSVDDRLVFVGDYIDRGPSSAGVLELMLWIKNHYPKTVFLRGNHEQILLEYHYTDILGVKSFTQRMESYDLLKNGWLHDDYFDFFQSTKYYYQRPGYIVSHAGLNFAIPDPFTDLHSMLWTR